MNSTQLLSPEDAGKYLGAEGHPVPQTTLQFWRHKGRGPTYLKIGRKILYRQNDLDAFIAKAVNEPETV